MTRSRTLLLVASASLTGGLLAMNGCQVYEPSLNANLAPEPPAVPVFAGTTQPVREWDRSVATIANGDTVAGSPGTRWRTRDDMPLYAYPLAEPAVFIANIVVLPYTLIAERGTVVSSGLQFPPSHTAMPPFPQQAVQPDPTKPVEPVVEPTPGTTPMVGEAGPTTAPIEVLSPSTQESVGAFTIAGQVVRSGAFDATGGRRLSDVVAAAGPASEDPAKVRVTITRGNEQPASTTLAELRAGTTEDVTVQAGDVIGVEIVP